MAELELPVTLRHGLTANMDFLHGGGSVHLRGLDREGHPISLRLNKEELELLQAVQKKAEEAAIA